MTTAMTAAASLRVQMPTAKSPRIRTPAPVSPTPSAMSPVPGPFIARRLRSRSGASSTAGTRQRRTRPCRSSGDHPHRGSRYRGRPGRRHRHGHPRQRPLHAIADRPTRHTLREARRHGLCLISLRGARGPSSARRHSRLCKARLRSRPRLRSHGVRDYDPTLGQFTTPDPLYLEDLEKCQHSPLECSLYGYAAGNPISFVDPTGTDLWDAFIQRPPTYRAPDSQAPEYVQAIQHDFAATDHIADGTIAIAKEIRPSNQSLIVGASIVLLMAGKPELAFLLAMSQARNHDETVLPIIRLDLIRSLHLPRPPHVRTTPGILLREV